MDGVIAFFFFFFPPFVRQTLSIWRQWLCLGSQKPLTQLTLTNAFTCMPPSRNSGRLPATWWISSHREASGLTSPPSPLAHPHTHFISLDQLKPSDHFRLSSHRFDWATPYQFASTGRTQESVLSSGSMMMLKSTQESDHPWGTPLSTLIVTSRYRDRTWYGFIDACITAMTSREKQNFLRIVTSALLSTESYAFKKSGFINFIEKKGCAVAR